MDLYIYIITKIYPEEPSDTFGVVMNEYMAKEIIDILNKKVREQEDYDKRFDPVYSYYKQKVYGTIEDFIKEHEGEIL